jgi:hypothetical protein
VSSSLVTIKKIDSTVAQNFTVLTQGVDIKADVKNDISSERKTNQIVESQQSTNVAQESSFLASSGQIRSVKPSRTGVMTQQKYPTGQPIDFRSTERPLSQQKGHPKVTKQDRYFW